MTCARCQAGSPGPRDWCRDCERAFDAWSRRHATDVVWAVLSGMVVLSMLSLGLPLLGAGYLAAVAGVFAGFGSFLGLHRLSVRHRRKQFQVASLPRAYLSTRT